MNKSALVATVAEKTGLEWKVAEQAVKAFQETVADALAEGNTVQLTGFGTFAVKERAARSGLNPRTKEIIEIPASRTVVFRAGTALKKAVK